MINKTEFIELLAKIDWTEEKDDTGLPHLNEIIKKIYGGE